MTSCAIRGARGERRRYWANTWSAGLDPTLGPFSFYRNQTQTKRDGQPKKRQTTGKVLRVTALLRRYALHQPNVLPAAAVGHSVLRPHPRLPLQSRLLALALYPPLLRLCRRMTAATSASNRARWAQDDPLRARHPSWKCKSASDRSRRSH